MAVMAPYVEKVMTQEGVIPVSLMSQRLVRGDRKKGRSEVWKSCTIFLPTHLEQNSAAKTKHKFSLVEALVTLLFQHKAHLGAGHGDAVGTQCIGERKKW